MNLRFQNTYLQALGIFIVGLVFFTVGLSHQEIIGFESRFYLFALEMWRHGLSWFPTTYGDPYPDYPATTTMFIYWVAKCFNQLNKFTAVLPSAIAAAVTLAMTYLIGALHSQRWGFFAVCFLLMTNMFLMEARTISPDQYVAMVTVISFYVCYSVSLSQKQKHLCWLPVLFLLGFACRGPIGLVVPAGVICVFYLLEKNVKLFFLMGFIALLVLVFASMVLFAAAYHVGGYGFMQDVMRMQVSGRLQDAYLPWYFYFVESIGAYAVSYPLAILVVAGMKQIVGRDKQFMLKLLAWVLIILIGLSLPAGKKIRYILACAPALALISAYLFMMPQASKYFLFLRRSFFWLCFFLPVVCVIGVEALGFMRSIQPTLDLFVLGLMLLQIIILLGRKQEILVIAAAALVFVWVYILIVEPINLDLNRTHDFVVTVEAERHAQKASLAFYKENSDALPIKYVTNMAQAEIPLFVANMQGLRQLKVSTFIITSSEHYALMPRLEKQDYKIIYSGNVGHEPVVVLVKKNFKLIPLGINKIFSPRAV